MTEEARQGREQATHDRDAYRGPPALPRVALDRWLATVPMDAPPVARVVCFPHAGGGPAAYRRWARMLPPGTELALVQLPGRERRFTEAPLRDAGAAADGVARALAARPQLPLVLFGHSMGALLAYEVARRLRDAGLPPPRALLVSAHRAPHLPGRHPPIHALPDARFLAEVERFGALPPEVRDHPELREVCLPLLRADIEMAERYRHEPAGARVPCGVVAYGGRLDPFVTPAELDAWSACGDGPFALRLFDGGHFSFLAEAGAGLPAIARDIHEALRARPG